MKRILAFLLAILFMVGITGCRLMQPDFEDFREYEDDFITVKNFLVDYNFARNDNSLLLVDIGSQFLSINGTDISDSSIEASVKAIHDKGFTYIEVDSDYIIFWEDETGYYGVLWSTNPKDCIKQMSKSTRPYLKSRKLTNEWYEIGALDSI